MGSIHDQRVLSRRSTARLTGRLFLVNEMAGLITFRSNLCLSLVHSFS
jgi:hypothetical protein